MRTTCKDCGAPITPNAKRARCKLCRNARERAAYSPQKDRERHLRMLYGIDQREYDRMFLEQGGMCFLCEKDGAKLVVDHDHLTGRVRRLLCAGCNNMVGYAENKPQVFERIRQYVKDHKKG